LRDELSKLIIDNYELLQNKVVAEPVLQVELNGGRF
jgi:hypothetical protein